MDYWKMQTFYAGPRNPKSDNAMIEEFEGPMVQWADTSDPTSWEPVWKSCHWALLPFHFGPLAALRIYQRLWLLGWRPLPFRTPSLPFLQLGKTEL